MSNNTIRLLDYSNKFKEFVLAAAATAGMLVERTSAGQAQPHSSAGATNIQKMFLFEKELEGIEMDTELASGDRVQVWYPLPGDEVYALLANGENVSEGDKLASDGAGGLQAATNSGAGDPVAIALEDLDLSAVGTGDTIAERRIKVEVL